MFLHIFQEQSHSNMFLYILLQILYQKQDLSTTNLTISNTLLDPNSLHLDISPATPSFYPRSCHQARY